MIQRSTAFARFGTKSQPSLDTTPKGWWPFMRASRRNYRIAFWRNGQEESESGGTDNRGTQHDGLLSGHGDRRGSVQGEPRGRASKERPERLADSSSGAGGRSRSPGFISAGISIWPPSWCTRAGSRRRAPSLRGMRSCTADSRSRGRCCASSGCAATSPPGGAIWRRPSGRISRRGTVSWVQGLGESRSSAFGGSGASDPNSHGVVALLAEETAVGGVNPGEVRASGGPF
jgi:hypothetical protein